MQIERIEFENFGSFFGVHSFELGKRGLVLVHGKNLDEPRMDSNGAGKSTVFDALDWGLFGKIPRGDHVDSVVNEEALAGGQGCRVRVQIRDDAGAELVVERGRKRESWLTLHRGLEDLTQLDRDATQEVLERHLGVTRDIFHAAVLFGQGDLVHYADATESRRLEILTQILQLEALDEYLGEVKRLRALQAMEEAAQEAERARLEGAHGSLQGVDFGAQKADWERARQARVLDLQAQIQAKGAHPAAQGAALATQAQQWRDRVAWLQQAKAGLPAPDRSQVDAARDRMGVAAGEVRFCEREVMELGQPLLTFDHLQHAAQGICPQCRQAVSGEHLDRCRREQQAKIVAAGAKLGASRAAKQSWDDRVKQLEDSLGQARQVCELACRVRDQEIQEAQRALGAVEQEQRAHQVVQRELEALAYRLGAEQAAVNPVLQMEQDHFRRIEDIRGRLGALVAAQATIRQDAAYLDFWVKAFGPEGLKSYILDSRQNELTQAANHWVRLLTGGTFWVQFQTQKQTRSKKMVNAPEVRIFKSNPDGTITERNFRSWSGGEKQRISFALDFGLSRLVAQRAACRYDLLILDEVFRHLDRAGKEAVVEMLVELAGEKSSVFVVEHDIEFQSYFENQVAVQKKNRRSTLEEIQHGSITTSQVQIRAESSIPARDVGQRKPKRFPV
jgi:DNA repair exonuclease SbcCD ATPase subunit